MIATQKEVHTYENATRKEPGTEGYQNSKTRLERGVIQMGNHGDQSLIRSQPNPVCGIKYIP